MESQEQQMAFERAATATTHRTWELSVPQIDFQAASPMPESPSSDQNFFMSNVVDVSNRGTSEGELEDTEDQLKDEREYKNQAFDDESDVIKVSEMVAAEDAETGGREMRQETDEVDAGGSLQADSEHSPASENDARVVMEEEIPVMNTAENLADVENAIEPDEKESDIVIQTKLSADKSAILDEFEDKLRSISAPDANLNDGDDDNLATLPDETTASDEETYEREETEWNKNADDEQTAVELEEVHETEIEASAKQPVDAADKQLESFYTNDLLLSSCVMKDSSEPETGLDDHDTSERPSTANEDDTLEGRMSADTSEQIFISHMIEAANRVDSAAAVETPTNSASNETRILESTLGGIALGFDEEEVQEERLEMKSRAGLPFGILDPRSPEPPAGPFSYIGDLHCAEAADRAYHDDENTLNFSDNEINEHNRTAVASSPRCLVESPPEQLSPTHELALKDELSPITEQPVTCRKKVPIGASPSGFILEEDEEEEEELEQVNKQGFFRPIVSSDHPDSDAEEIDLDEERKERLENETDRVSETKGLHDKEETDSPPSESDGTVSPFDVITSEDLAGYSDYENRASSDLPVQLTNAADEQLPRYDEEADENETGNQEGIVLCCRCIFDICALQ